MILVDKLDTINQEQECSYCSNKGKYIVEINTTTLTILCNFHYVCTQTFSEGICNRI